MNHSKWNYIAMGVTAMGAFVGALAHNGICLIINLGFTVLNWHVAEARRKVEEQDLLDAYELSKQEQEKND